MTPTEIETAARDVAVGCLTAIRKCRASGRCEDRDIREIIELRVERALSMALLGYELDAVSR